MPRIELAVIRPGQVRTTPAGGTVLLTGTYSLANEVSGRRLRALPPLLARPGRALDAPLIALLAAEIGKDRPGQDAVLDRLLDLLLIAVPRAWLDRPEADPPGGYRAYADPIVGPAPREPGATVGSVAARVGYGSPFALSTAFKRVPGVITAT